MCRKIYAINIEYFHATVYQVYRAIDTNNWMVIRRFARHSQSKLNDSIEKSSYSWNGVIDVQRTP